MVARTSRRRRHHPRSLPAAAVPMFLLVSSSFCSAAADASAVAAGAAETSRATIAGSVPSAAAAGGLILPDSVAAAVAAVGRLLQDEDDGGGGGGADTNTIQTTPVEGGSAPESDDGGGIDTATTGSSANAAGADNGGSTVCPPCQCSSSADDDDGTTSEPPPPVVVEPISLNIVALQARNIYSIIEGAARDFEAHKDQTVRIRVAKSVDMPAMYRDIINDANSGGPGLYDGYFTNPVILGQIVERRGFTDLTPYVRENPALDWTDILLPFRKYVAQVSDRIYMLPLDGDVHSMYVRRDILEHFGLAVPRTWDEYNAVAGTLHGETFDGIRLSGSCVSRVDGSHGQYWSHLILSSFTQTDGPATGSLFDTKDMKPLTGEALVETLRILEEQMAYGVPTEFDDLNLHEVHSYHINDGTCALTYSWGDTYKLHRAKGSVVGPGQLGVYPTPGTTKVLDRKSMKLVPCTKERCKYGKYYDDLGWVNYAPYLANGGWSGAVSANAEEEKQKLAAEFFMFACGKNQAVKGVIPNSTTPFEHLNSQDPFRKSQMEVDKWVDAGYDAVSAKEYQVTVLESTLSKNLAIDLRTPEATEIMVILDKLVHAHLVEVRKGGIPESKREQARQRVAGRITEQWVDAIDTHDRRGDTESPILQIYQQLRDVYVANEQLNQLTKVRPVGLTFMAFILVASMLCMLWVLRHREDRVVRASQPAFLNLICVGTIVMASSILPMSIDDGIASEEGCSIACMATPWLFTIGFTLTFSALFSKIWRLNILMKSAASFRRVEVKVKDVMPPLVILLGLNIIFLSIWTAVDARYFVRVDTGRTGAGELSSYGTCKSGDGVASTVMIVLILIVNIAALVMANIQAYQTRTISIEYSESKYIFMSMVSILQAVLIGSPIMILAGENPTADFIVSSMLVFVITMSVLGLMFVPKFLRQRQASASRQNADSYQTDSAAAPSAVSTQSKNTSTYKSEAADLPRPASAQPQLSRQSAEESEIARDRKVVAFNDDNSVASSEEGAAQ